MPLSNLAQLRLRAGDPYRAFQEQQLGDGSAIIYQLSSFPIQAASETIYIDGAAQSDPGDYGLDDDLGRLTFVSAPGDGAVVQAIGNSSIFSDTELNDVLDRRGNVRDALIEVLEILMMNEARREKWSAGDLSSDPTKTTENLAKLYDRLLNDRKRDAIDAGGMEEWSLTQAEFTG